MKKLFWCLFVAVCMIGTALSVAVITPEITSPNQGLTIIIVQMALNLFVICKKIFPEVGNENYN